MNLLKKCVAVLLTGVMVLSLAGCGSDSDWIMKSGELTMPVGVYVNSLLENYYVASAMVEDKDADVLSQTVEGKDASQWIIDESLKTVYENMGIYAKFEEMGLELSEQELATCESKAASYYQQAQENLKKNNITQEDLEMMYQLTYMKVDLFNALYGEGGTEEIPEEELRQYYEDNYIKMAVEGFQLPDELASDASEEEKQEYQEQLEQTRAEAEKLYQQAQQGAAEGKSWDEVLNEYKSIDPETGEKDESYDMSSSNYRLLDTATTTLNSEVITALKNAKQGEVIFIEAQTMLAVGATTDINADPTDYEFVVDMIRHAIKDEEFSQEMQQLAQGEGFTLNEQALETYSPDKITTM